MTTLLFLLLTLGACSPTADTPVPASAKPADRPADWWKGETGWCGEGLTSEHLDTALELGRSYLVANQLPEGNFTYEYDWRTRKLARGDSQVRQAGAAWGVALLHRDNPTPETREAAQRAIAFWRAAETVSDDGRRWHRYGDDQSARLGTLALVSLAHIELLRSEDPDLEGRDEMKAALEGYIAQMLHVRRDSGLFHDRMLQDDGTGVGRASPYSDGETLLALVKAARYLGRDDLWPTILHTADAAYEQFVTEALREDPDSDTTKGYYQWGSMSWYEIATSDRPAEVRTKWEDRLMDLAVWMVDTHYTLKRRRNTAYAYEGIVPAYAVAKARGDKRADKLSCVIQMGLRKLSSWQIGHPLALAYVAEAPADDPKVRGGVQNARNEALLRVDVVQHQMHAVLLARDLWASPEG